MSDVKRYDMSGFGGGLVESEEGAWYHMDDYAKLEAEARALREERDSQQRIAIKAMEEVAAYEDCMRSLACQLGAGGFNAEKLTASELVEKVQWGINNLTETQGRLLDEVRSERDAALEEVEALRHFAGEIYQVLGALDAPENVLDNASDAASGDKLRHKTLLPFAALRARVVVVVPKRKPIPDQMTFPGGPAYFAKVFDEVASWNDCLDELARLNGKAVSEGLLRRVHVHLSKYMFAPFGEPLPPEHSERAELATELGALLDGEPT